MTLNFMMDKLPDNMNKNEQSNVRKVLRIAADRFDESSNTIDKMKKWRDIDNSKGVTLDLIGKDSGQPRDNMNDEQYREKIKSKTRANLSIGDIETLNDVCGAMLGEFFLGIDEGWTLPQEHPIGPRNSFLLFSAKAGNGFVSLPMTEIDRVTGGGIGSAWQIVNDNDVKMKVSYNKYQTELVHCGEVLVGANLTNALGVL